MAVKYFETQQDDESVIILVRRHIIAILSSITIAILIYIIGIISVFVIPYFVPSLTAGFGYNVYVLIISLLFLFNTVFLFNSWLLHYLHVAILTSEHFVEIEQSGPFVRKISAMSLDKIQDVTFSQKGLVHTVFNLGTVEVQTAGEAPNFVINFSPNPSSISQTIMETEEEYCTRHGIRINEPSNQPADIMAEPRIEYPGGEWKQEQK